jgi:3-oxoadipate enol-lactonase
MIFLRANGILTHAAVDGPPHAPAVVFANSLGTDLRIWNAVAARLGPRIRAIRYDMRGHGLSEATPGDYSMATLADDLAALLDALRVRGAVVVGLSVGGLVAQALAARRPELVRALVLCCTAARVGDAALWQARIDAVRAGGMAALADAVIARWFPPTVAARIPDLVDGLRLMLLRTPADGYAGICAALRDADQTAATRMLKLPTLCVAGSEDPATTPDVVRGLAVLVQGARMVTLDGSGHLPCIDAPEATARHIEAFLAEISHA